LFRSLQAVGSLFAAASGAGILDGLFDRFPGFAGALLNPANKFFLLAFGELEIVIRELGPLLFQLALGDVPVALNFEFIHNNSFCLFVFVRRQRDGKSVLGVGLLDNRKSNLMADTVDVTRPLAIVPPNGFQRLKQFSLAAKQ
jgi:hypothetical protein